jgi:Xaa-Pro aminopeptidase
MSILNRIQKLREKIKGRGLDALLISQNENRYYLSGFNGEGYLLITGQDTVLMTDFRYTEQAVYEAPDYRVHQITGDLSNWFPAVVASLNGAKLGFEATNLSVYFHSRLLEALNGAGLKICLVPVEGLVETLRAVKEPEEIEFINNAARITDGAFAHIRDILRAGMPEREAAWVIERYLRENGSDGIAFEVIVAGGANGAMAHHRPSSDLLFPGVPIVLDFGARYQGYCSDLTRTLTIGVAGPEYDKRYNTVLEAQFKALEEIKAGMTGEQADAIARNALQQAGLGDAFGHGLGHGIGLAIHESPRLGPRSTDVLENGMVFSVEPGIYLPGWGGIRIEDSVVMEGGRVRRLTQSLKVRPS